MITSLQPLWLNPGLARGVLAFHAAHQAHDSPLRNGRLPAGEGVEIHPEENSLPAGERIGRFGGQVAAQLLTLSPGAYTLATRTAAAPTGKSPLWSIACGEDGGPRLADLEQPSAASAQASIAFVVPAGCQAQWLTLNIRPYSESNVQSGAIEWVTVARR